MSKQDISMDLIEKETDNRNGSTGQPSTEPQMSPSPSTSSQYADPNSEVSPNQNADDRNRASEQFLPSIQSTTSPSLSTNRQDAISSTEVSENQRYKVRAGTRDQGREYEFKIAALLALRSVGLEVTNFWLALNAEGAGAFDDLILHLEKSDGKEVTFMLQLKHKENPNCITQQEFSATKGDFSLYKYYADISNLYKSIHCDNAKKSKLVKDLSAFSNIYFMLFSNRGTYNHNFLEQYSNSHLSFLNTNSDETVYRIDVTKVPDSKLSDEIYLDCNLFLFSNQVSLKHLDDVIVAEVKRISCMLELSNLNIQDVAKGFVSFTTEWAKGNLGGDYYLTKKEVVFKLTELFLNQYTLSLIEEPFVNNENDKLQIWNQVIANQPITVVDYSETALNFLIKSVSTKVQKYCGGSLKNWVNQLSKEEQQTFYNSYSHLKQYILKYIGSHGRICPLDIYKSLWRVNKLPLLLKVSSLSHLQNISTIVKFSNYSYKVIVLHESLTLSCSEGRGKQKDEEVKEEITKSFKTLKDLDKTERNKILELKVKLQGRPGAILEDIVNEEMLQYITSKDILHILSDDFSIGNELQEPVEYIIERTMITKGVKSEVLRSYNNEIFLILGNFESLNVQSSLDKYKSFEINTIDLDNTEKVPGIINIQQDITSQQLQKLQKTKKPIHILLALDSNYLGWMWSYGSRKTVEKHEVQLKYEVNQENIAKLLSTAAIISDVPGMGKSVLTDYIAYHAPVNKWVLKLDLNQHQSYFRQKNTSSTDTLEHLRYFYDTVCCKSDRNSELSRLIFQNFVNLKKIAILLDGFDEVVAAHKDKVTNMAKSLHEKGYQVLITTRPNMKQHLEETFEKASISIMPFTRDHQRKYLIKFFTSAHSDLNVPTESKIQIFVEKLIKMVSKNLNDLECEFMGIPLQSRLLTDVFSKECRRFVSSTGFIDFNNDYDLLYLYDKFVENKVKIFVKKYGDVAYEQHEDIREHQALLAIKLIFPLEEIIEADILEKVYQHLATKPKLIQLLQREGIMIVDVKGNITCVHRTIAEFLAAQWLSDNLQNMNENIKKFVHDLIIERFTWNYKFLFHIFDRILSQNCSLNLAIINKQINVALNIINSESDIINVNDKGGRSVLHITALNGLQYPLPYDHRYTKEDKMLSIVRILVRDEIIMKRDMLGYTPLDYALASCSLQIANELCTNNKAHIIYIYINLQYKTDYLRYCERACKKLFQILLPYFASRDFLQNNVKKDTNLSPYYYGLWLTEYKNKNIIQLLQSICGKEYSGFKNDSSADYYSDLRHALVFGSTNNVKQLLQHEETEINKTDIDNNTLLHYAVLHGQSEILKLLLEKDAKVNKQNKDLNTPLHLSLLNCDIKITEMLLSKKVNLDSVNIKGETVLHLAFSNSGNKIQDKNLLERYSAIVESLCSKCTNINSLTNTGETPLHYSVKNGFSNNIINYLLLHKADVNKMSYDGQTPLHFAAMEGHNKIIKLLVENRAAVNAQDVGGYTPLIWAAKNGRDEILKFLVANGADINAQTRYGDTSLILATEKGHDEIVKILVTNRAAVNAQDVHGYTPLVWAAKKGHDEIVKFLVANGAAVDAQTRSGNTPLILAAEKGHDEIVKILVANGAAVNAQDVGGNTPLLWAAKKGHNEIVKILVANMAAINVQNISGHSPLIWAAEEGRNEIVKLLVKNGANLNAQDRCGDTLLIWAAKTGQNEIVKSLVANGANVNAQDINCNTPLLWAAQKGHYESVKLLVANRATVNAQGVGGFTSLIWAAKKGCTEIVTFLIENGADVNAQDTGGYTPLVCAARKGREEIVKFLVTNGADVNAHDGYGKTPLIWAAKNGHDEIVKFLVTNGADVNAHDLYGNTSLIWDAKKGSGEIVKFLIANGADVNAQDTDGNTPLIWAAVMGRDETVKFLVANKANVNAQATNGDTPLICATRSGHNKIIKFLRENGA